MAKISLREYNREIDELIEQGQMEQAIAHCRHILQFYPKHIDTYRSLGKAYLEAQRFSDASDVLQRVLSSVPDDFVSHIGMSLIREDEGNLDEAIWHMERAFENQPSNSAIQNELKRLYGRRDGMEPPKVRLTRGALARMYLKGELYPQAIAELRSALSQEQARPDLQLLLAQAYYQAEKPVQAAETCSILLNRLPYCVIGNQIMAEILANSKRSDEAKIYRQRVHALDPYAAHVSPKSPRPELVPDAAVTLERLDWRPGETVGAPDQPDWATSVGVDIQDMGEGEEELPEWLESVSDEEILDQQEMAFQSAPPFDVSEDLDESLPDYEQEPEDDEFSRLTSDFLNNVESDDQEELIPDWMKEAGWEPASGEADETSSVLDEQEFDVEEELDIDSLAEPGDIPDWLQSMAPEELEEQTDVSESDEVLPETIPDQEEDLALFETDSGEEISDWMEELDQESPQTGIEEEVLEGIDIESDLDLEPEEAEIQDEVPEWMQEFEAAGEQPEDTDETLGAYGEDKVSEVYEDAPDWMEEADDEMTLPLEGDYSEEGVEMPEWFEEESQPEAESENEQTEGAPEEPEWFSEEEDEGQEVFERKHTGVTDWLKSKEEEAEQEEPKPSSPFEKQAEEIDFEADLSDETSEELPEWLQDVGEAGEFETVEDEATELPEWLQGMDEDVESSREFKNLQEEAEEAFGPEHDEKEAPERHPSEPEELPDWMTEIDEEEAETLEAEEALTSWISEGGGSVDEEESVFIEEPPVTESDTKPTRVVPLDQISIPPTEVDESQRYHEEAPEIESTSVIEEEAELPEGIAPTEEEQEETEIPQWLQDWREETGTWEEVESQFAEEGAEPEEEVFPESEGAESLEPALEAETIADESELEEDTEQAEPHEEDLQDEDAFAWLENLAAKQGAEEALLLSPEERRETPPDWVKDVMAEELESSVEELEGLEAELEAAVPEPDEVAEETSGLAQAAHEELLEPEEGPEPEALEEPEIETEGPVVEATQETYSEAEEIPDLDDEEAFAWLEGLAAKQGAEEALLLDPSERKEEPPEWIKKAAEEEAQLISEAEPSVREESSAEEILLEEEEIEEREEEREEEFEAEVETTSEPITPMQVESPEEEEPELPKWLAGMEDETESGEPAWTPPTEEEKPMVEGEIKEMPPEVQERPADIEEEKVREEEEPQAEEEIQTEAEEPSPEEEAVKPEAEPQVVEEPAFEVIDINTAGLSDLEKIPGIGFTRAQAIIAHRETYGSFSNVQDLEEIFGIGPSLLEEIKDLITVKISSEIEVEEMQAGEDEIFLMQARNLLVEGKLDEALIKYNALIVNTQRLEDVIQDLNEALYHHPVDADLWQSLGDANMHAGNLQEALDAYSKAEELLR